MTTAPVFRTARDITPEAASLALRRAGLLDPTDSVAGVAATPIGTGQMADSLRLELVYEQPSRGYPASMVVKLASTDERSRSTGRVMRAYEVEVGFYRDLAESIAIRTPRCYLAELDPDTHEFVLVLEDLAPAVQGDQIAGCDVDTAAMVLEQAAALHAPRWNDPALEQIPWLARSTPESAATTASIVGSLLPSFLDRYGESFTTDVVAAIERGVERVADWWRGLPGARTVVHGDLRLDNLLLGEGLDEIWTVDWQTAILGNGVADAAYFIGGNLPCEIRRANEDDLIRHYHGTMVERGVSALSWDECMVRYRHGIWHGVFLGLAASMLVEQTERGDLMFITNIDRHVRHALDHEAFDVFDIYDDEVLIKGWTGA